MSYVGEVLVHHGTKGMKWGVRRYQNKDGSLTPAGKKRYDRDVRENNAKKKDNRIVIDGPDANRWANEDLKRTKGVVDASSNMTKELRSINNSVGRKSNKKNLDLSNMTDQQLRDKINRANLERQYNDIFAPQNEKRGRDYVDSVLSVTGTVLGVGSSALAIALAIKELRG